MAQRKLPPGSTARRVLKSGKKVASSGKTRVTYEVSSLAQTGAKVIDRMKKGAPPKPAAVPDEVKMPGFVGMLRGGRADLAARAKDVVRGPDNDK